MAKTRWNAILVLTLWLLGAECSYIAGACEASRASGSPEAVAKAYLQAWIDHDWEAMYGLLDKGTRDSLTLQQFREVFTLRFPLEEEVSYFAPATYVGVKVERQETHFAVVSYTIGFTREGCFGKRLASIIDAEKRRVASNEERYRMRIQAAILLSDLHNTHSPYANIEHVLWVKIGEYVMLLVGLVEEEIRPYYPLVLTCTARDAHKLSAEDLVKPHWQYLWVTSWGAPAAVYYGPMLLRKEGGRWVVANAVLPLTEQMRAQPRQGLPALGTLPQAQQQTDATKTVKLLADMLGLLD